MKEALGEKHFDGVFAEHAVPVKCRPEIIVHRLNEERRPIHHGRRDLFAVADEHRVGQDAEAQLAAFTGCFVCEATGQLSVLQLLDSAIDVIVVCASVR